MEKIKPQPFFGKKRTFAETGRKIYFTTYKNFIKI